MMVGHCFTNIPQGIEPDSFSAWWDTKFQSSPSVRHLRLGSRSMLFCERSQQIFELNSTANSIWGGLAAGKTPRLVAGDLEALGASGDFARQYVVDNVFELLRSGVLLPIHLARPYLCPTGKQFSLQIGDFACRLRVDVPDDDPLPHQITETFQQFFRNVDGERSDVAVVAHSGGFFVWFDGNSVGMFSRERVIPEIKARATEGLAKSTRGSSFLLHAALLSSEKQGLLISGSPGAGKTTLTTALAARGLGYASDDIVKVSSGSYFQGIRFAAASKEDGWHLIEPYVAGIQRLPAHVRRDGCSVRYIPVGEFERGEVNSLGWVILLDRRCLGTAVLQPIEPIEALLRLLGSAFSGDRRLPADSLATFARSLSRAHCFRLVYSDLASAITLLEELIRA